MMQKSSEIFGDSQEFMEILTDLQKIILKSKKDFKFSCETQGGSIKIEVLIQKDSVKTEYEGWISNKGNNTCIWPDGCGVTRESVIEVERRNGKRNIYSASSLEQTTFWRSCDNDPYDIINFRIVK
jgi:hypothetical protein